MSGYIKTIKVSALKRAVTQTGPTVTVNGTAVDLQPYAEGTHNYQAFLDVTSVLGTTPNFAAKVQESDSTASTSFTDISGAAFTAVTATTGNANPESIYFVTAKRYVRIVGVTDAATTQAIYDAWLLGQQRVN